MAESEAEYEYEYSEDEDYPVSDDDAAMEWDANENPNAAPMAWNKTAGKCFCCCYWCNDFYHYIRNYCDAHGLLRIAYCILRQTYNALLFP